MSMPAALRRRLDYVGPSIFSYGFRPFFLGGALWAALSVLLWLPQYFGELSLPTAFDPLDWHIHEMIYGHVGAVSAGFLLTAIPNWTGRLPINGYPLAGLFALWLMGRLAILGSAIWGCVARRGNRHRLPGVVGGRGHARDRRWQQQTQSPHSRPARNIDRRQYSFSSGSHPARQRRIRRPSWYRGNRRAHLVGRRTYRAELHPQLADAEQSRPASYIVFAVRCDRDRQQCARVGFVDRIPPIQHLRRDVDHRGTAAGGSLAALGGRSHARRPPRPGTPCRLRLRPDRLPAVGRGNPAACRLAGQRRPPRLDGRSRGPDDAGGHDARKSGSHRMQACRIAADAIDLSLRARRRIGAHFRGF